LNLPNVPMTDVAFQKQADDLVVATQGRGFYVLDDMPLVRAMGSPSDEPVHLYAPKETYRYIGGGYGGGGLGSSASVGKNPPSGVAIFYRLKSKATSDVVIRIKDSSGKLVNELSSKPEPKEPDALEVDEERHPSPKPTTKAGLNRFVWDMRYPDTVKFPGMIYWAANTRGPLIIPGTYTMELTADGHTETQKVVIKADPRVDSSAEDYRKQLDLSLETAAQVDAANKAVISIRLQRKQLDTYATTAESQLATEAKRISTELGVVEDALYQTKLRANEDALNFPIKLNNKLAALLGVIGESDTAPTEQSYAVFKDLDAQLQVQLSKLAAIDEKDVVAFNRAVKEQNIPAITVPGK
jgi:hypothetical protein